METIEHRPTGPWDEFPDEYWRAYFGSNADHYMIQLERIRNGQLPAFNWAAFLITLFWMAYRRMHLLLTCVLVLSMFEGTIESLLMGVFGASYETERYLGLVISLVIGLLFGTFGDRMYIWDARRMIRAEVARGPFHVPDILLARIASRGGTSWLPIVVLLVVLIGIVFIADALAFDL